MSEHNGQVRLSTYLQQFLAQHGTPNTAHQHRSAVHRLCRFVGHDLSVYQIDDQLVEFFAAWLSTQKLSTTTQRLYLASIRSIGRAANPEHCPKLVDVRQFSGPGTLMTFFREVYRPQRMTGASEGAVQQHVFAIWRFAKHLGRPPLLSDLTDDVVSAYIQWMLDEGLSRATANSARGSLLALWRHAYRTGRRAKKAGGEQIVQEWPDVQKLREHRRLPRAWTIDEMQRLLTSAAATPGTIGRIPAGPWWTALLLLLYETGLRRRAAFLIERAHIDLDTGWLTVPADNQKQKVEQRFKLSDQTIEAIRAIWDPPRRLLFPWPWRKSDAAWGKLTQILVAAGLPHGPKDKFHKLRKTCASHIAKAAGVSVASMVLGHSDVEVTKRYIDPTIAGSSVDATAFLPRLDFAGSNGKAPGGGQRDPSAGGVQPQERTLRTLCPETAPTASGRPSGFQSP